MVIACLDELGRGDVVEVIREEEEEKESPQVGGNDNDGGEDDDHRVDGGNDNGYLTKESPHTFPGVHQLPMGSPGGSNPSSPVP